MKKRLWRIIIAALVFIVALLINNIEWLQIAMFVISYIIAGGDIVKRAVTNILRGKVFDENFLMSVATIGAFLIGEYPEGIAVMLFYQVGELFQSYAVDKSRRSIADAMDIRPDYANVKRGDEVIKIDPDEVQIGDIIVIKPGERVPLDGKVIEGNSMVDTSALTGESVPREVEVGHEILSGCININGVITASSKRAQSEQGIAKVAGY